MRNRDLAAQRSDIRNRSLFAFQHLREHGKCAIQPREEVRFHLIAELIDALILDGANTNYARIVDQHINRAELFCTLPYQLLCLLLIAEIS